MVSHDGGVREHRRRAFGAGRRPWRRQGQGGDPGVRADLPLLGRARADQAPARRRAVDPGRMRRLPPGRPCRWRPSPGRLSRPHLPAQRRAHAPRRGGVTQRKPAGAALLPRGGRLSGVPGTVVRCWSLPDWVALIAERGAYTGGAVDLRADGFVSETTRVNLAPRMCDRLVRFAYEGFRSGKREGEAPAREHHPDARARDGARGAGRQRSGRDLLRPPADAQGLGAAGRPAGLRRQPRGARLDRPVSLRAREVPLARVPGQAASSTWTRTTRPGPSCRGLSLRSGSSTAKPARSPGR